MGTDPQNITIRGRLSWPNWTYADALKQNVKSKFPKKDDEVRPSFNLLLTQARTQRLVTHLTDVFLPWCAEQEKNGGKSGLSAAHIKKLNRILADQDWEADGVMGLIYNVHEKTKELAPEAVSSVKVNGFKGRDLDLQAVVKSEADVKAPADDLIIPDRGLILPVNDTKLELYPGSVVAATINLFAFVSANQPGITANTSTAIFVEHDDRFGGGGALIDEDSVFMDDDE